MINEPEKRQMRDYLAAKLVCPDGKVEPKSKELVPGITSNYIHVGQTGIVMLVDQPYPRDSLQRAVRTARVSGRENLAVVFYKDGETFFRNAAEDKSFKSTKDLSLKRYNPQQMHQMISTRPEEMFAFERSRQRMDTHRRCLQYYQPSSARLSEGLESFHFVPVMLDYSHIPEGYFRPENKPSKKLLLWDQRNHEEGNLTLTQGYLVGRAE